MELIPTKTKVKIPSTESYPLGAQEISIALDGAPQKSRLSIWFRGRQHYYRYQEGSKYPGLRREYLLGCTLRRRIPNILTSKEFDEYQRHYPLQWVLWVYSVPRNLRHSIHEMLVT